MNAKPRRLLVASALLVLPVLAAASPPPILPWATSSFSFELPSGRVEFRMECPGGALTRLSAVRGKQVVELPVAQLAVLPLSKTCAGASTRAEIDEEGSRNITGIGLQIDLSHEYIDEELWVTFDLQAFRFTKAMHLKTYAGETTQVERVELK